MKKTIIRNWEKKYKIIRRFSRTEEFRGKNVKDCKRRLPATA